MGTDDQRHFLVIISGTASDTSKTSVLRWFTAGIFMDTGGKRTQNCGHFVTWITVLWKG